MTDPRTVGPYRMVARLSAGGMGRVYLAESPGGRQVAVKIMRPELTTDPYYHERFKREVAAARKVGGYHTAQVIDADPDAEEPWMVTAYIPAPSLQDKVKTGGPFGPEALRLLAAGVSEGLTAIHASGVVHRDLKPRNILMADDGPRIIDFGLSRPASLDGSQLTVTGQMVGTPGFMSPEQVKGDHVGPPSDIFSFGGVLVYAATGAYPFGDHGIVTTTYAILNKDPRLDSVDQYWRVLIRACMAKEPKDRPTSAELLDILGDISPEPAVLPPHPVLPRDPVPRDPLSQDPRARDPVPAQPAPDHSADRIPADQVPADQGLPLIRASKFISTVVPDAESLPGRSFPGPVPAPVQQPVQQPAGQPAQQPVTWHTDRVPGQAQPEQSSLPGQVSPSWPAQPRRLPRAEVRPSTRGWSLLAADPAGRWLASADADGAIAVWDLESGLPVRSWSAGAGVLAIAASPAGVLAAATEDGLIRLWDVVTGTENGTGSTSAGRIGALAFDRTGTRLATGDTSGIQLWQVGDGYPPALMAEFPCGFKVTAISFGPDAGQLAAGGPHARVHSWDLALAKRDLWPAPTEAPVDSRHSMLGNVVALSWDDAARQWVSVSEDGPLGRLRAAAVITSTGQTAAVDENEGQVRVFPTAAPHNPAYLHGSDIGLRGVATFHGASVVVLVGTDGSSHLWHRRQGRMRTVESAGGRITALAVSPDESRIAVCDDRQRVQVYDVVGGSLVSRWSRMASDRVSAVAFRPDGKRLATAGDAVRVWSSGDGGESRSLPEGLRPTLAVAYDPSSRRLAGAGADGTVLVWDGSKLRHRLAGHKGAALAVAFGPAGSELEGQLITAGADGTIRIWDLASGEERESLVGLPFRPWSLAVSPSVPGGAGALVAVGCADGNVRLCRPGNWTQAPVLTGHVHGVTAMCFAAGPAANLAANPAADPAGRLVTASRDGTARVWDLGSRRTELLLVPGTDGWAATETAPDGSFRTHGDPSGRVWFADGLARQPF